MQYIAHELKEIVVEARSWVAFGSQRFSVRSLILGHRFSGLFRGLTPSRKFHYICCVALPAQICSPIVLRSIPAAASTFAAFEITRGMTAPPSPAVT